MTKEFGKILDVKTELYYDDKNNLPLLKMVIDYENGILEFPKINLDKIDITKKYSDAFNDYIVPKDIISCNLTMPLELSEGVYGSLRYKYPEVNKVYNINNNLIVGVDQ